MVGNGSTTNVLETGAATDGVGVVGASLAVIVFISLFVRFLILVHLMVLVRLGEVVVVGMGLVRCGGVRGVFLLSCVFVVRRCWMLYVSWDLAGLVTVWGGVGGGGRVSGGGRGGWSVGGRWYVVSWGWGRIGGSFWFAFGFVCEANRPAFEGSFAAGRFAVASKAFWG